MQAILEQQIRSQKNSTFLISAAKHLLVLFTVFIAISTVIPALASQQGQYDGPAELPRVTVASAMSDTPAPGVVTAVNAGDDLQQALNNAQCGDTLELQAGATFTGPFTIPAKHCDINHWIIVRTSASDIALPAEGQRLTPCYAGIASLPGRPPYSCNNPQNVLAKVQMAIPGDGPFHFASGANYYRFVGLEITRPDGTSGPARLISALATADHFVLDRSWLHGALQDETFIGITLDGMTNVAVVDSYFSDFHCISVTGLCTDAHAIGGGVSNTQDGPFKIQDNFLEASGQGILFGGGPATASPSDIEILGNHFWKPWQWMPGDPHFIGGANGKPFIVKNHLEFKNAVRVLVDSNLMENNWGGFTQNGGAILLTPKNQHSRHGNVCPKCQVTDITVRYVRVAHAGGGLELATSISGTGKHGAAALAGTRWSVHDLVIDDLNANYGGGSVVRIANDWPKNPVNTITINHMTAFPDPQSSMIVTGNSKKNPQMSQLVFTNNLLVTGEYPVWNKGGGPTSCAYRNVPLTTVKSCFATYSFVNNGLIAPPPQYPPSDWPAKNLFAPTIDYVQFTNYNNGNGGNYELLSTSPYKNAGTDGKDLGADVVGLNQALANVE